jgi:glycosyltransferase involved in cell wall biosynthesis
MHTLHSRFLGPLRFVSAGRQLRRILKRWDAKALLTLYGGGYATAAFVSGFKPYTVFLVGSDVHLVGPVARVMTKLALRRASDILANGESLAAAAEHTLTRRPVTSLYIGVDTAKFTPKSRSSRPIRIVCTRGFEEIYNNDYLIQALSRLSLTERQVEVLFVSSGSLLEQSKALADALVGSRRNLRVHFLGGADESTVVSTLRDAHIYVSTSRSDGTSISLMEALACGAFPILSDIPANAEWVNPAFENGLLVPLDDPPALATALARAINDDALRARAEDYNRAQILARADATTMALKLRLRLEETTRRHGGG